MSSESPNVRIKFRCRCGKLITHPSAITLNNLPTESRWKCNHCKLLYKIIWKSTVIPYIDTEKGMIQK